MRNCLQNFQWRSSPLGGGVTRVHLPRTQQSPHAASIILTTVPHSKPCHIRLVSVEAGLLEECVTYARLPI